MAAKGFRMIFVGAPGVGKGTYAKLLSPIINIPHISTGDLIREEINSGSELGQKVQQVVKLGNLVSDDLITPLLRNRLDQSDAKKGFILDGYPRSLSQIPLIDAITPIDVVVHFFMREDLLVQKISARRVCSGCGENYNLANIQEEGVDMPAIMPKVENTCDKCSSSLFQRGDDEESIVRKRLALYKKDTFPLVEKYRERKQLLDFHVRSGTKELFPELLTLLNT